jgi:hypothetical protein
MAKINQTKEGSLEIIAVIHGSRLLKLKPSSDEPLRRTSS